MNWSDWADWLPFDSMHIEKEAWEGFKKTRTGKVVYPRKKHFFRWKNVLNILLKIETYRSSDFAPLRACIKIAMIRLRENFDSELYRMVLQDLAREETEFREFWKQSTLAIIDMVIAFIAPEGIPSEAETFVQDLLSMLAEKYYDFLFSL